MTHPLDDLLTFAERAYIRMEAEQLISLCLEDGDTAPFLRLIEQLVLAGATSLGVMREILDELRSVRTSLMQDGLNVRQNLIEALSDLGIRAPELTAFDTPRAFRHICSQEFRRQVIEAARSMQVEEEALVSELCAEAGDRITLLANRMLVLSHLESAVRDWFDSLAYQASQGASREGRVDDPPSSPPSLH